MYPGCKNGSGSHCLLAQVKAQAESDDEQDDMAMEAEGGWTSKEEDDDESSDDQKEASSEDDEEGSKVATRTGKVASKSRSDPKSSGKSCCSRCGKGPKDRPCIAHSVHGSWGASTKLYLLGCMFRGDPKVSVTCVFLHLCPVSLSI